MCRYKLGKLTNYVIKLTRTKSVRMNTEKERKNEPKMDENNKIINYG